MGKRNNKSKNNKSIYLYIIPIIIGIIFLTSGYSAFVDSLGITSIVTHIRAHKVVRVNGVTTNSGHASDLEYDHDRIISNVYIPAGDSITYTVTVTNLGSPVAVSGVSFQGNGETISALSSNINSNDYIKICDNNNCEGPITKEIEVTITNNSNETISREINAILTFSEIYDVTYEGNKIGEAIEGGDFSYIFESNPPANVAKSSGTSDTFSYTNGTISLTNVRSDITLLNAYTIYYNGSVLGHATEGGQFSKSLEPEFPATVTKESGTCNPISYQAHTVSLTNVMSDIYLTGTIGKVAITAIRYIDSHNVVDPTDAAHQPQFTGDDLNVSFNVVFRKDEGSEYNDFQITYEVDLTNTHYNDYIFRGFDFNPTITASAESDTAQLTLTPVGINNGDTVDSEKTKTFRVTLVLEANNIEGEYTTGGTTQVDTTEENEEETGEITATISPNTGNIKSNAEAQFSVTVNSTYPSNRTYTLNSSNSNIDIVACNSGGSALGSKAINSSSSPDTYPICLKAVSGAKFVSDTDTTNIYLSTDGLANVNLGTITLNVDKHDVPDTTPLTIGEVKVAYHRDTDTSAPTTGQIDVSWKRKDCGGSGVDKYYVELYDSSGTRIKNINTESTATSFAITGLSNGTYYAVVYGLDKSQNSGASYASSQTSTADGYASASEPFNFTWTFTVDTTKVNTKLTVGGDSAPALLEKPFTITITGGGSTGNTGEYYIAPASGSEKLKVYMGDSTTPLEVGTGDNQYTYSRSQVNNRDNVRGTIKINKVTGNIRVEASPDTAGCLIEGTKILLANGKYKNIENIGYDDLLTVYNHETGSFVYEYPIWIEKGGTTDEYKEISFSDGSILKTFSIHALFETDLNRFVNVTNSEEFHVGSRVAKFNNTNSDFDIVTVTKIETKKERVNYYQVVSSIYFNLVANGLFVSDGHVNLLNRYGFTDNIVWNKEVRDYARKDVYEYEDLKDVLPRHLFEGTLAKEAKILIQSGYGLSEFRDFISFISDENTMMAKPIQQFGKNMWMVTTSLDNVTDLNKKQFLRPEGSTYTLPNIYAKNFIGWLNYSDNLMYQPGDKVTVYHGMHFEAIYK